MYLSIYWCVFHILEYSGPLCHLCTTWLFWSQFHSDGRGKNAVSFNQFHERSIAHYTIVIDNTDQIFPYYLHVLNAVTLVSHHWTIVNQWNLVATSSHPSHPTNVVFSRPPSPGAQHYISAGWRDAPLPGPSGGPRRKPQERCPEVNNPLCVCSF